MNDYPPLSPSQQERMKKARALIKSRQHTDAIRLLKTIDHPLAYDWLKKLQGKATVQVGDSAKSIASSSRKKRKQHDDRAYPSMDEKPKRNRHERAGEQRSGTGKMVLMALVIPLSCMSICLFTVLFGSPDITLDINDTPILAITHEATTRPTPEPYVFSVPIHERDYDDWPPNQTEIVGDLSENARQRSRTLGAWTFTLNPGESPGIFVRPGSVLIDTVLLYLFQQTPEGSAKFLRRGTRNYGSGTIFTVPESAHVSHASSEGGEYIVVVRILSGEYDFQHYDIELVRTQR
jgi:hypothetical protein